MQKNEETITMTIDDFRELVKEEVQKQVGNYNTKQIFPPTNYLRREIEETNKANEIVNSKIYKRAYTINKERSDNSEIWKRTKRQLIEESNNDYRYRDIFGSKKTFSVPEVHNSLRKLSLAVFGQTLNSDLKPSDYAYAKEYYLEFMELFIDFYNERLEREYPV